MAVSYLKVEQLEYSHASFHLGPLNFCIERGECLGLIGHSGVGKSTLVEILAGFRSPTMPTSSIVVNGQEWLSTPDPRSLRIRNKSFFYPWDRNVGLVLQKGAGLQPERTVRENLEFGIGTRTVRSMTSDDWDNIVDAYWLRESEERSVRSARKPPHFLDRKVDDLSGGQITRVALARGLARVHRSLYLLDEPFEGQDYPLRQDLVRILRQKIRNAKVLNEMVAFIFVTHNQDDAILVSDKIVLLERSEDDSVRIRASGTPRELLEAPPNLSVARFVGDPPMNLFEGVLDENGLVEVASRRIGVSCDGPSRNVVVGLRPSDLQIVRGAVSSTNKQPPMEVAVVERRFLGHSWLYELGMVETVGLQLPLVEGSRFLLQTKENLHEETFAVQFPTSKLHVFNTTDGRRLQLRDLK